MDMKRIRDWILTKLGHGKHCDRALAMAHLYHEHAKVHHADCEKCAFAVDFIEPGYATEVDRGLRTDG